MDDVEVGFLNCGLIEQCSEAKKFGPSHYVITRVYPHTSENEQIILKPVHIVSSRLFGQDNILEILERIYSLIECTIYKSKAVAVCLMYQGRV